MNETKREAVTVFFRSFWVLLLGAVLALFLVGSAGPRLQEAEAQAASGTGLRGEYFGNQDLTSSEHVRIDPTVDFSWGRHSPVAGIEHNSFSVRWTGQVEAADAGTYTFYVRANDGARLWVNGELLIDTWVNQKKARERSGNVTLEANERYDIKLEYYDKSGAASVRLSWSGPGLAKQVVPQSALYPADTSGP